MEATKIGNTATIAFKQKYKTRYMLLEDLRVFMVRTSTSTVDRIQLVFWESILHIAIIAKVEHSSCIFPQQDSFTFRKILIAMYRSVPFIQ